MIRIQELHATLYLAMTLVLGCTDSAENSGDAEVAADARHLDAGTTDGAYPTDGMRSDAPPADAGGGITCEAAASMICSKGVECELVEESECAQECGDNNGCEPGQSYHPANASECVDAVLNASCEEVKNGSEALIACGFVCT